MLASEVKKYCLRRILAQYCSTYECHISNDRKRTDNKKQLQSNHSKKACKVDTLGEGNDAIHLVDLSVINHNIP